MLKVLLKKQMTEVFRAYYYNPKTGKARSRGGTIARLVAFAALMIVVLGGMFGFLAALLCAPLYTAGYGWLYFTLFSLFAVFLGAFGSVFNTYSGLYLSKDNDLLLAMPIPIWKIIAARLLGVYLLGAMYAAIIYLPAMIVYWVIVPFSVGVLLGPLVQFLLLTLFVLCLSCLLGYVVAKISQKLKNKSAITVIVSLVFFGAYYFFYAKAQSMITALLANITRYGDAIRRSVVLYAVGKAGEGDALYLLCSLGAVAVLFALTWALLSKTFLGIATAGGGAASAKRRAERAAGQKSIGAALLGKELQRLGKTPAYMLNCAMGTLFLLIVGVFLLVRGSTLLNNIEDLLAFFPGIAPAALAVALCFAASVNDITTPSVSLEGKSLWILRSLPVTTRQILRAKLSLHLLLTLPGVLFAGVCGAVVLGGAHITVAQGALVVLLPLLFSVLSALFGLVLGIRYANVQWTNEIVPIKQSGSVFVALFGGMLFVMLLGGGYFLLAPLLGVTGYLSVCCALVAVLCALCALWLRRRGEALFEQL